MPELLERFSPPPPTPGPFPPPEWGPPHPPSGSAPLPGFYPLTIGRGVSLAFHLFRFGWRTFVSITVLAYVPLLITSAWAEYVTFDAITAWQQSITGDPFGPPPDPRLVLTGFPATAIGLILLVTVISGFFTTIGGAALIHAIAGSIRGERLSARRSFRAALGRLRSLLGLYLILTLGGVAASVVGFVLPLLGALPSALGIGGGPVALLGLIVFVALIFGFIFVMIRIAFAIQVLMIEEVSIGEALRRSWFLLSGSMLRLVGWMIVFALVVALLGLVFEIVGLIGAFLISPPRLSTIATFSSTFGVTFGVVESVASTLAAAVFQPLIVIGSTLLYFEIRWRHGESVPVPGQPQADPVHSG
ncbi:MAG TPA: hypothetical protein VIK08_06945 [Candidatus Limnocylindrales bacterium]